jgi:hypothetical protein
VRFNLANATVFTQNSSSQVTATVPSSASTGLITVVNSNGCAGQSTANFQVTTSVVQLNLKVFIEGMYAGNSTLNTGVYGVTNPNLADSLTVMLRQTSAPYSALSTQKVALSTSGIANLTYPGSMANQTYYIAVKTRNSVETWSKNPVTLVAGTNQFNFAGNSSTLRVMGGAPPVQPEDRPEHPE